MNINSRCFQTVVTNPVVMTFSQKKETVKKKIMLIVVSIVVSPSKYLTIKEMVRPQLWHSIKLQHKLKHSFAFLYN